jgi:hypothetical protein
MDWMKAWRRRVREVLGPCVLAGGLAAMPSLGGTTASQAVNQITGSATQGLSVPPPPTAARPDQLWVPDRWVPAPGQASPLLVPGHWEQRIDERRSYSPPIIVVDPATGASRVSPAGIKEQPPAERTAP